MNRCNRNLQVYETQDGDSGQFALLNAWKMQHYSSRGAEGAANTALPLRVAWRLQKRGQAQQRLRRYSRNSSSINNLRLQGSYFRPAFHLVSASAGKFPSSSSRLPPGLVSATLFVILTIDSSHTSVSDTNVSKDPVDAEKCAERHPVNYGCH